MALNRPCEPSLMGIPRELRGKILEKLFENEQMGIVAGYMYEYAAWPMTILFTCHILYDEAKEALRKRVTQCGIRYREFLPPQVDELGSVEQVSDKYVGRG